MLFAVRDSIGELAALPELVIEGLRVPTRDAPFGGRARAPGSSGSSTSSWPKPVGTRSLSWSYRVGSRRPTWPAGSACRTPCRSRGAWRTGSCSALRRSRRTPGGFCSSQRPTRPAIPRSSGVPRRPRAHRHGACPLDGADLIEFGTRVRFRHPLVRSAVYRAAEPDERRRSGRRLPRRPTRGSIRPPRVASRRGGDRPRRVRRRRARASRGRAQARGGLAAAAVFLERAAALTPDPVRLAQRALAAARTKYEAGAFDDALALLATAERRCRRLQRAHVDLLRAQSRSPYGAAATLRSSCWTRPGSSRRSTRTGRAPRIWKRWSGPVRRPAGPRQGRRRGERGGAGRARPAPAAAADGSAP